MHLDSDDKYTICRDYKLDGILDLPYDRDEIKKRLCDYFVEELKDRLQPEDSEDSEDVDSLRSDIDDLEATVLLLKQSVVLWKQKYQELLEKGNMKPAEGSIPVEGE
jgi:hypothetical protein